MNLSPARTGLTSAMSSPQRAAVMQALRMAAEITAITSANRVNRNIAGTESYHVRETRPSSGLRGFILSAFAGMACMNNAIMR